MPSRPGVCGEKVFLLLQHLRLYFLLFHPLLLAEESRGIAVLPPAWLRMGLQLPRLILAAKHRVHPYSDCR